MGLFALILAVLGGLSAVMGIVTAADVVPSIGAEFTWMFWFVLALILFVAAIASLMSRGGYE